MIRSVIAVVVVAVCTSVAPVHAQGQQRGGRHEKEQPEIPRSQLPPKGMCRIWLDGVPAAQQPAPTDCATAVRNRPANARIVFSSERETERVLPRPPIPVKGLNPSASGDREARGRNEEPKKGEESRKKEKGKPSEKPDEQRPDRRR